MDITNNDMVKEICEHLDLMLSFAEKTGITIEGIPDYAVTRDGLSFSTEKFGVKEENDDLYESVTIHLNKESDKVKVIKETQYRHNFKTVDDDPDCQNCCTICNQVITEFLVGDGELEVTTALVTQTIYENTYFGGPETIADFDSIADCNRPEKLDSLPQNHSLKIEIKSYSIPEDYHITDGVGPIDNNPKVMEKTTQS